MNKMDEKNEKRIDGRESKLAVAKIDESASGWFDVSVKLWHADVHLFVGSDEDLVKSGRVRFKDDPTVLALVEKFTEKTEAYAITHFSRNNAFVVRVGRFRPCMLDDMLTLSHEALHVAQLMLNNVGAEVEMSVSETLAYTHQYVLGRLMHELINGSKTAKADGECRTNGAVDKEKEFVCKGVSITRQDYESMPCPMCAANVDDATMQLIANDTHAHLINTGWTQEQIQKYLGADTDFADEDGEGEKHQLGYDYWRFMEKAALEHGMKYYEDMAEQ